MIVVRLRKYHRVSEWTESISPKIRNVLNYLLLICKKKGHNLRHWGIIQGYMQTILKEVKRIQNPGNETTKMNKEVLKEWNWETLIEVVVIWDADWTISLINKDGLYTVTRIES